MVQHTPMDRPEPRSMPMLAHVFSAATHGVFADVIGRQPGTLRAGNGKVAPLEEL